MKATRLADIAPRLCDELRQGLRAESKVDLAAQVDELLMNSWRHDKEDDVLFVSVHGGKQFNIVEKRIIGEKYGGAVSLNSLQGVVSVDMDNFNRIRGIEAIGRADLAKELQAHGL